MSDANREILRERFIVKYDTFRERLRKRLGSDDLARESLQETWLQLARSSGTWSVPQPNSYLFGIALNMAAGLGTQHLSAPQTNAQIEPLRLGHAIPT